MCIIIVYINYFNIILYNNNTLHIYNNIYIQHILNLENLKGNINLKVINL